MELPIILLIIFIALIFSRIIIRFVFPNKECKWMDCHYSPKEIKSDGCSLAGKCSNCGCDVLQDSQGNWFRILSDNINNQTKKEPK